VHIDPLSDNMCGLVLQFHCRTSTYFGVVLPGGNCRASPICSASDQSMLLDRVDILPRIGKEVKDGIKHFIRGKISKRAGVPNIIENLIERKKCNRVVKEQVICKGGRCWNKTGRRFGRDIIMTFAKLA
jgi:hypothetical protein